MSDAITDTEALPAPPPPGAADALDEALAGLPAPPRVRTRVLGGLLTAISVTSVFLAWQLRDDVKYAFASSTPVELGDGRTADVAHLGPNRLVRVRAAPQMAGAVQYSRLLYPGEYTVFPIAGRTGEPLYVQVDGTAPTAGGFTGRLIQFGGAGGRYRRVGSFLSRELNAPVSNSTYLIVDGATPRSVWWAPLLASFLLALAVSDMLLLYRLLRPLDRH